MLVDPALDGVQPGDTARRGDARAVGRRDLRRERAAHDHLVQRGAVERGQPRFSLGKHGGEVLAEGTIVANSLVHHLGNGVDGWPSWSFCAIHLGPGAGKRSPG